MSALEKHGGWPRLIGDLLAGNDLSADAAGAAMTEILSGSATPAQIAGFVVALRAKGESSDELAAMLRVALVAGAAVPLTEAERADAIDVVGTGGDGSHSINVSTMAAIVAAGAGVPVCKHGNRSASSKCGTADVLELLGVAIEQTPDGVAACLREAGIAFCMAPMFHPAFRFAGPPRREMGVPTVFNLLGPMANPGRVKRQLIGVADPAFARPMIEALRTQGLTSAWVVHGDGLDELTTAGTSDVLELSGGEISSFTVDPSALGLAPATARDLRGGEPEENAEAVRRVLAGDAGPHRDVVLLNAAAALVVAGRADDLVAGLDQAAAAIDSGAAQRSLDAFVTVSQAQPQAAS
ncbi:anthranilate phosphoribosyltransferase [Ilumatobacter coccineus]|jgi:anthranilate phosphoribosyltransferase|uniref:Anthranilate phosphoribosyltransferase n=1 Tax=Ilumatobacter coccineus (strain NBRC 103263 / KCTC 29153 / YM16-304) TaxID=1313172 RepID=A0A6C7E6W1_ILUCY|nr:anthranilate phosphoribosyltransferase [Ilumatobacter coccineus]BAN02221.1 anthranilate phosphoribosyltransferase [Ilumatobacter coccineus YM16-304]